MGAINDVFTQSIISVSKIEEIFKILLENNVNKKVNIKALQEIGLLKEYSHIKSSNELTYFSGKNKIIKIFIKSRQIKENYVEWTKYLFDIDKDDLESDKKFSEKIENLKKNPLNKVFFQNNLKKHLFDNNLINHLLNYGIPNNFREMVWELAFTEKNNNQKYFNFEEEQKEYNSYLRNVQSNSQIEKDLNRTLINESEKTTQNINILKNILNCIYKYNNGYCQGINFIVGFLLKLTNYDEIRTFYIFKNIIPEIKGYFEDDFPLLKKNINFFDYYFQELYPKLYKHFKKYDVYNELWVGRWFQTLFTLSIPFEELCNIWDVLIIKGFDFIIYISLAIIGFLQKELLELKDSSDILSFLQKVLFPKEAILIYKKQLEEDKYTNIIPLFEILSKANKIEKSFKDRFYNTFTQARKSDNNLDKFSNILKREKSKNHSDQDSLYTKESDSSLNIKHSFSSKSSSTLSSSKRNSINLNLLNSPSFLTKKQNSTNELKSNLSNQRFEPQNKNIIKKSTIFSSKTLNPFNLSNDNKMGTNDGRTSINVNNNNLSLINMRNSYNIYNYPPQTGQCIYYNNMNYSILVNRPQYQNYVIYYA
jgi:hypothetical protein